MDGSSNLPASTMVMMSLNKVLSKYDKIFIDTAGFLIDPDSLLYPFEFRKKFKSDSTEKYSDGTQKYKKSFPNLYLQEEFFLKNLYEALKKNNQKLSIPYEVIEEIKNHTTKKDKLLSSSAKNALKIIQYYKKEKLIEIYRGENYPFTDNVFITVFFRFMTKYNMCLVTQDRALGRDIAKIKTFEAIDTYKKIDAYYICIAPNEQITLSLNKRTKIDY